MVSLGKVVAGHGVRGLARIKPFNPGSPALRGSADVWLAGPSAGRRERRRLTQCRPHRGMLLAGFEGIDSLDALEPWIGAVVEVELDSLPTPDEGELYHFETIGLQVETTDGEPIGTVVEVMAMPANDLWVVRGPSPSGEGERETLIPAVAPIVERIDLSRRVAVIAPPPGLLDGS